MSRQKHCDSSLTQSCGGEILGMYFHKLTLVKVVNYKRDVAISEIDLEVYKECRSACIN